MPWHNLKESLNSPLFLDCLDFIIISAKSLGSPFYNTNSTKNKYRYDEIQEPWLSNFPLWQIGYYKWKEF